MTSRRPLRLLVPVAVTLVAALLVPPAAGRKKVAPPPAPTPLSDAQTIERLAGMALTSDEPYDTLAELCDRIGHRLSGSPQLDRAVDWAQKRMRAFKIIQAIRPYPPRQMRSAEIEILRCRINRMPAIMIPDLRPLHKAIGIFFIRQRHPMHQTGGDIGGIEQ